VSADEPLQVRTPEPIDVPRHGPPPLDLDDLPFAVGTLADLEAERAAREDQLEHIRAAYPDSRAIRVLTNYLAEIDQEIAARGLIGA
jgi:hypothetical protein